MPEAHLTNSYMLPDYEDVVLRQDSPEEAAEVLLNLLDTRYAPAIVHNAVRIIVASWVENDQATEKYSGLLANLPAGVREQLAICHAVFTTGDMEPDPDDIPDAAPLSLMQDWNELDDEAQNNVLLNAVHMAFTLKMSAGTPPFAVVYQAMTEMNTEAKEALVSKMMTQYVRQFHLSRQNRN